MRNAESRPRFPSFSACVLAAGWMIVFPGLVAAQGGDYLGQPSLLSQGNAQNTLSVTGESASAPVVWSVSPYAASGLTNVLLPGVDGALSLTNPAQDSGQFRETSGYSVGFNLTALPNQGPWNINGRVAYSVNPDKGDARDRVAENVFRHVSSTLATGYALHDWEPYVALTFDKKISSEESTPLGVVPNGSNVALGARFDFSNSLTGEVSTSRSFQMRNQTEERNILGNLRLSF
ncbi:MAG: hypothetical protein HQL64_11210 [Magnetococcales bacterium]|nr:hypothetical protein [Magnetococcales bacterium]